MPRRTYHAGADGAMTLCDGCERCSGNYRFESKAALEAHLTRLADGVPVTALKPVVASNLTLAQRVERGDFHVPMPDICKVTVLEPDTAAAEKESIRLWGRKWSHKPGASQSWTYVSSFGSRRQVGNGPSALVPRGLAATASLMTVPMEPATSED